LCGSWFILRETEADRRSPEWIMDRQNYIRGPQKKDKKLVDIYKR